MGGVVESKFQRSERAVRQLEKQVAAQAVAELFDREIMSWNVPRKVAEFRIQPNEPLAIDDQIEVIGEIRDSVSSAGLFLGDELQRNGVFPFGIEYQQR